MQTPSYSDCFVGDVDPVAVGGAVHTHQQLVLESGWLRGYHEPLVVYFEHDRRSMTARDPTPMMLSVYSRPRDQI